jgi:D-arabinose 1-dehydrogenase-like Zn-dependent alcohol dehydrogenase
MSPAGFKWWNVQFPSPAPIRFGFGWKACGICHTDAATVTGIYPGLKLPRVPAHEVLGRIEALGSGVSRWKIGQRVGVGFFGGEDGVCEPCRRGDIVEIQAVEAAELLLFDLA